MEYKVNNVKFVRREVLITFEQFNKLKPFGTGRLWQITSGRAGPRSLGGRFPIDFLKNLLIEEVQIASDMVDWRMRCEGRIQRPEGQGHTMPEIKARWIKTIKRRRRSIYKNGLYSS